MNMMFCSSGSQNILFPTHYDARLDTFFHDTSTPQNLHSVHDSKGDPNTQNRTNRTTQYTYNR